MQAIIFDENELYHEASTNGFFVFADFIVCHGTVAGNGAR
jgi:hypothetical protein